MILVIDNYDSFTYNLVQYIGELGAEISVRRNDEVTVPQIRAMGVSAVVLSPGPCTPAEAGVSVDVVRELGSELPILGVCLGHQAIGAAYGAEVVRAAQLMHGKTSMIRHDGTGVFRGLPDRLNVMRYHSLTVSRASIPDVLEVAAWSEEERDEIHALRHRSYPVWGVQFHPESVLTQNGKDLLRNFLELAS